MVDRFESRAAEWNFNPRIIKMFHAFVASFRKEITLNSSMHCLDVGGGTGLIAAEFADSVKSITIVDSSASMAKVAREHLESEKIENVTIIESDILTADVSGLLFDCIYCHMSLHHIENIDAAFERFSALTAPGGVVVIGDLVAEDGSFHGEEKVPHNGFDTVALTAKLMLRRFGNIRTRELESIRRPETGREYSRFMLIAQKNS